MIKGLLIDLDGVIYNDTQVIDGAVSSIHWLQKQRIPFRFITNTTMKSRATLQKKLRSFGIIVPENEIFSAVTAAAHFIAHLRKEASCYFLLTKEAIAEFFCANNEKARPVEFVVVGDMGEDISSRKLNKALRYLMDGASLIALQKNRFWLSDEGYKMDAGAFVAMLEYAAQTKAIVAGKPSSVFFNSALASLGMKSDQVLMIGDDMESDIIGAKGVGIKTCLVQSGKYRPGDEDHFSASPDMVIPSICNLPELAIFSKK